MSANNSDSIGDSSNDFDGPLHVNDAIDTAVGRRVSDAFAAYADGIHAVAPHTEADSTDDGAALLLQTERGQAALARLARVHPKQHAAVIATVVEGLTVRDAAPRFRVSPKSVHYRKHRGLEKLRAWCQDGTIPRDDVA